MALWNSLPEIVRQILICVCSFIVGAFLAFGYSYRPLHGALTFQVETLEERIDERNRQNLALRDEITLLKSGETSCIEPDQLREVELELGRVRFALSEAKESVEREKRSVRDANANADRWRERFHAVRETNAETVPTAPATVVTPPPAAPPEDTPPVAVTDTDVDTVPTPPQTPPEPLLDAPFDDFSVPAAPSSPTPSESGILLPSDTQDPF